VIQYNGVLIVKQPVTLSFTFDSLLEELIELELAAHHRLLLFIGVAGQDQHHLLKNLEGRVPDRPQ